MPLQSSLSKLHKMATLRLSSAALRPASASFSSSSSASLSRVSVRLPLRPPRLKLASRRSVRRRPRGAAGAVMMDTAASSYASALADVARDNCTLDSTLADMEKVDRTFSDPDVQSFFDNPTISAERKREVICEIAKSSELQPHTANFLNILIDMSRIGIVKEIVEEFEVRYNEITGTEVAVVSAVVRLDSHHLAQIAQSVQRLTGANNVRIKTIIDPSLVAGFTIRYGPSGSKLIDMSVKKHLDEIAAQLDFSSISLA